MQSSDCNFVRDELLCCGATKGSAFTFLMTSQNISPLVQHDLLRRAGVWWGRTARGLINYLHQSINDMTIYLLPLGIHDYASRHSNQHLNAGKSALQRKGSLHICSSKSAAAKHVLGAVGPY